MRQCVILFFIPFFSFSQPKDYTSCENALDLNPTGSYSLFFTGKKGAVPSEGVFQHISSPTKNQIWLHFTSVNKGNLTITFSKNQSLVDVLILKEKEGEILSYLFENKAFRVFSTKVESKGKLSKTGFKVLKESKGLSLLEIQLFTGRKHQIRVHLSEKGNPVVGDKMYGRDEKGKQRLALHSASLKLVHPETKKEISFKTGIPDAFKSNFK
jgi:hypothetical protein